MPLSLAEHFSLIRDEYAAALAAPLSARKALAVTVLLDQFVDRAFAAFRTAAPERVWFAEDLLAYRAALRTKSPALKTIFGFCALKPASPRLEMAAWAIPDAELERLTVQDFMVSLYNGQQVQRVVFSSPDGTRTLAHQVLGEAVAWWGDMAEMFHPPLRPGSMPARCTGPGTPTVSG